MKWKPSLTIRENFIGGRKGVQLSDPVDMKRMLVSKENMLDAIVDADSEQHSELVAALVDQGALAEDWSSLSKWHAGIDHWKKRNWRLALSYYLWARRETFLDEGPDYEDIRCEALRTMLDESDVPLPDPISDSEKIDLGVSSPIPESQSVGTILGSRRTSQAFNAAKSIDCALLSGLLENGFSISRRYHTPNVKEHIHNLLHGVGFAFDPYIAVFNIDGLEPGIYYYNIGQNRIRMESPGCFRQEVCSG